MHRAPTREWQTRVLGFIDGRDELKSRPFGSVDAAPGSFGRNFYWARN